MTLKKILPVLLLSVSLYGCSALDFLGDKEEKKPLPGERISILDTKQDLQPDQNAKLGGIEIPAATQTDWQQSGSNPQHSTQHMALSANALKKAWSSSIGDGSRKRLPLTAQPIVAGKVIYTLDTDSEVSAFSTEDGKRYWTAEVRPEDESDPAISGGISYDNGVIYVTAGYDEVVALDSATGQIKWRSTVPAPSRAAPTIIDGRVFVTTIGNAIIAMNAADGRVEWEFAGLGESTGLVGAASPAGNSELVIPAFSSGEIYALRTTNGSVAWSDNLSGNVRLGGMTGLSDIRGLPVIEGNMVYAISYGGKLAAIDIRTGARQWQRDISGTKTPAVVGNRVFVISAQSQIAAFDKDTGAVAWVSQLARYEKAEEKTGVILWAGPIFAGGRLLAFSTDGRAAEINPEQGTLIREWKTGEDIRIAPLVADGALYLLSEDGDLIAYR